MTTRDNGTVSLAGLILEDRCHPFFPVLEQHSLVVPGTKSNFHGGLVFKTIHNPAQPRKSELISLSTLLPLRTSSLSCAPIWIIVSLHLIYLMPCLQTHDKDLLPGLWRWNLLGKKVVSG